MQRKVTISDVAQKAGVGKVTVSYVLNGQAESARISSATAERVIRVATELNYRPNALARMLVKKKAEAIGVVFQYGNFFGSHSSFISEVLRAICHACVENQIDVVLHTREYENPLQDANALTDGRVDAVIIIRDENDPVHSLLMQQKFPSVLFFCRSDHPNSCFVVCDNFNGGKLATQHLVDLGHKNIGMVRGGSGSVDSNDRFHGFRASLESNGLEFEPNNVITVDFPAGRTEELTNLMNSPGAPTALFVWSDDDAIQCVRHLNNLGLSVPKDVSIIGFDGTQSGEQCIPPLTTIQQPIEQIANTAVTMAIQLADDPGNVTQRKIVIAPQLVTRESTCPPISSILCTDKEVKKQ